MGMSGLYGYRNISGITITIDCPEEIFAKHPVHCSLNVFNNKKIMDSFLLRIAVHDDEAAVPHIPAGGSIHQSLSFTFPARGIYQITDGIVYSRFPFSFFIRKKDLALNNELIVFPNPVDHGLPSGTYFEETEMETHANFNKKSAEELDNIRNYEIFDSPRRIHWKHYAKSDNLKTKEYSGGGRSRIIDLTNTRITEQILSSVTFHIIKCYRENIAVGLKTEDSFFSPELSKEAKYAMLKWLALYHEH